MNHPPVIPRPAAPSLTVREKRVLERLQIKWHKGTITAEEKSHALALSKRAWEASIAERDAGGAP